MNETNGSAKSKKERDGSRVFAFFVGLSLLLLVAGGVWWAVVVRPAEKAVGGVWDKVERFFGGLLGQGANISINESSAVMNISNVSELALMEYKIKTDREVKDELLLLGPFSSKKSLRMEGTFKVKIGYDISGGLSLSYDDEGQATITGLGKPKVLSAEMVKVNTLADESGIWNKVSAKDRDLLVGELRIQAIRNVKESGLLEQVDELMKKQLKLLLGVEDLEMKMEPARLP